MNVAVAELVVGDSVLVRPGGAIPVDGEVVEGESEVDESLLTGESAGVEKAVGARVVAGSIATTGSLTVRVTGVGDPTPRSPASCSWSPTRRRASRARSCSPIARPGCCSTSPLGAALVTALVLWLI